MSGVHASASPVSRGVDVDLESHGTASISIGGASSSASISGGVTAAISMAATVGGRTVSCATGWTSKLPLEASVQPTLSTKSVKSVRPQRCLETASSSFRFIVKVLGISVIGVFFIFGFLHWPLQLIDDEQKRATIMSALFAIGLLMVMVEDHVNINKAAIMLIVSATMWTFLAVGHHPNHSHEEHEKLEHELEHGLKDVASIILFLLPAMGVVESIDHFDGFAIVTHAIRRGIGGQMTLLMPVLCLITFAMSAIIDNLTATIVALKILRHVVGDNRHLRHLIGGLVVIAANAGGAWSPVGDVTTTMLWLSGNISAPRTVQWLFLPSLVAAVVPMAGLWAQAVWEIRSSSSNSEANAEVDEAEEGSCGSSTSGPQITLSKVLVLALGIACIFMVPVLKMTTGLPPYMGMLLALGIIWFVTDTRAFRRLARQENTVPDSSSRSLDGDGTPTTPKEEHFSEEGVIEALHKMDLTGLLFFAGVLLAVSALNTAGVLKAYAELLVRLCGDSPVLICSLLGISSAIVDNVPLVEAAINMFDKPQDDPLWQLVALAAGTGGSILSVGSIAGVTLMTMEGVGYLWYCRRVSLWAALGFACGIATYQLERQIFG